MSTFLQRLVQLARAHLYDYLDTYTPGSSPDSHWNDAFANAEQPRNAGHASTATAGTSAGSTSGLPYSEKLARCYALLDLPFGVPMEQVNKRWKAYLKKCHPDRYANDPEQLADATELTQALTGAHDTIEAAWKRYQR